MLLVIYCTGAAVRAVQLTAIERFRVKHFRVMQTGVLGPFETEKSAAANADDVDSSARFRVELDAAATTDVVARGDHGSSSCAISVAGADVLLKLHAPVIFSAERDDYDCATGALPIGSATAAASMMLPASYPMWASVWPGIADTAPGKARVAGGEAVRQTNGVNGYREDHLLSLGRPLCDSHAPRCMVSNDRIRSDGAQLVLARRQHGIEPQ